MKTVPVEQAVGKVLGQDLTKIVPASIRMPFSQRTDYSREDIPQLLEMGKHNIYVYELDADIFHENDAASILAGEVTGEG